MAKRYIRINWQNRPSTATFVSAQNLNKMDKGIDDCDTAIEDLYGIKINSTSIIQTDQTNDSTKVPSSAVTYAHGQAISTINNNLATNDITGNITNEVGVSSSSSSLEIKGDIVDLKLNFSYNNAIKSGDWTKVMTLPTPARPISSFYGVIFSGTNFANLKIDPDGSVFIRCHVALTTGGFFAGQVGYIK